MADEYTIEVLGREHVGAIGQTQSGKSYAMILLLTQIEERNVIVVDTKHNVKIPGYITTSDERKAIKGPKVIYRPTTTKPAPSFWAGIWDTYGSPRKPNVTVFIDEAGHVTSPNKIDDKLELLVQAGKQNGVGIWWAAQQSTGVHNTLLSQSQRLLVFRVLVESDRKKIANVWGRAALDAHTQEPAIPDQAIGGEFMAFGFPGIEPIEADGKVYPIHLRMVG